MKTISRLCLLVPLLPLLAVGAVQAGEASTGTTATVPLPAATTPVSIPNPAPTAAQLAAADHLIKAMRLDEGSLFAIKQAATKLPEDVKIYLPVVYNNFTVERIRALLDFVYAEFLSEQESNKVAAFYESMAGKKSIDRVRVKRGEQAASLYPPMSAQDIADTQSFAQTAEARHFFAVQPQINKEVESQTAKLRDTLFKARLQPAFIQMQQWKQDELKARSSAIDVDTPIPVIPDTYTGIPEVDRAVRVVGMCYRRQSLSNREFRRSMREMSSGGLLKPENLVDLETVKRNAQAVSKGDMALEAYLKQTAANQEKTTAELNTLTDPFGKNFAAEVLRGIASSYARTIKLGENQRSILESYRHMLAFAETHHNDMRYADGSLRFTRSEDVQDYNQLIEQIKMLGQQEDELNEESRKILSKPIDALK
jgi:hypothetical protein